MRKVGFVVFVFLICGALVWACKGEPREQATRAKGGPVKKEVMAQIQVAPQSDASQGRTDTSAKAKILFEQTEYDFGKADQGEKIEHLFRFKNTGHAPLVINKVRSS